MEWSTSDLEVTMPTNKSASPFYPIRNFQNVSKIVEWDSKLIMLPPFHKCFSHP